MADSWRGLGLAGSTPFVVDPVCASMHGDPLLQASAIDALRTVLFPLASLVTPTSTRCGCWWASTSSTRNHSVTPPGRCDLGPRWALVKGGHLRGHRTARSALRRQGLHTNRHAPAGGDRRRITAPATRLAAAIAAPWPWLCDAGRGGFQQVLGDRVLRAAYPLGAGHGPVSALFRLQA